MNPGQVYFSDTTMRDGEQTPNVAFDLQAKIRIAQQLAKLNVDEIEVGFPGASPEDVKVIQAVAERIRDKRIAVLVRATKGDMDQARIALRQAEKPVANLFIPASDLHIETKLNKTRAEVLQMAVDAVKYARGFFERIVFSAEDATRSDPDFLGEMLAAAIDAGAEVVSIPDTVGYTQPTEFGLLTKKMYQITRDKAHLRVHCHNDLGMAVANTLVAVENGATILSCTINGMGERTGNAALEEVAAALAVRQDYYQCTTNINMKEIYATSSLIRELSGVNFANNKPVVGDAVFAHTAGIHQHAVLKDRRTYEIMSPELVGAPEHGLILSKHTGRHGLLKKLKQLGVENVGDEALSYILSEVKKHAVHKKSLSDDELLAIVDQKPNAN